jgi:tRNA threonylcarbamoyladenosine biosynthesis protein TsaE
VKNDIVSRMKIFLDSMAQFAGEVLSRIPQAPGERAFFISLQGELGAGKTTFMQNLGRALSIEETIQSPTYVLMKSYPIDFNGFTKLIHIDAYRLESAEEFKPLKPEQFMNDPQAIVCIEWPERLQGSLPNPDLALTFFHRDGEPARDISVQ